MIVGAAKCDSCGLVLDPELDANRFRHQGCAPPALPVIALDVIDRVNRRAGRAAGEVIDLVEGEELSQ